MNPAKEILSARNISKSHPDPNTGYAVEALREVSITVDHHEFVSVIGPSGCGKSTLLRIVAGLDQPSSGEISVAGQRVTRPGADRGMVFQEYALFPWKTTQANVEFGLLLKGVSKQERAKVAQRFIELVGLKGSEDKYPHHLSGGMRQRAAVARALANNPKILLMDEPFAAVDAMTRQRLQEELTAISAIERTTVLFVTHAIEEAVFLSDRVVVLAGRPGQVVTDMKIELDRPRRWDELARDRRFTGYCEALTGLIYGEDAAVETVGMTTRRIPARMAALVGMGHQGSLAVCRGNIDLAGTVLAQHLAERAFSLAFAGIFSVRQRPALGRSAAKPWRQPRQPGLGLSRRCRHRAAARLPDGAEQREP